MTSPLATRVADPELPHALPALKIDEPTLAMIFSANQSGFAGKRASTSLRVI
jgi:predicted membrane GTPase involved in stress response